MLLKKPLSLLSAACFIGCSVALYVYAGLGGDSITVFEEGIHTAFSVTMGMASYIYAAATFMVALLIGRKHLSILSVFYSLICGPSIDLFCSLLSPLQAFNGSIFVRIIILGFAILFTAISCSILIVNDFGMNALDATVVSISEKTKTEYSVVRTITDGLLMLSGYLMGGTVGLGTIPAVLLTGTVISQCCKILRKWIKNELRTAS